MNNLNYTRNISLERDTTNYYSTIQGGENMNNAADLAHSTIRSTGGSLCEVLATKLDDIVMDEFGNHYIVLGTAKHLRAAPVLDDTVIRALAAYALAEGREKLFETAVPNFDDSSDRAQYAKRLYARISAGCGYLARTKQFKKTKDNEHALHLVAQAMNIDDLSELKKMINS